MIPTRSRRALAEPAHPTTMGALLVTTVAAVNILQAALGQNGDALIPDPAIRQWVVIVLSIVGVACAPWLRESPSSRERALHVENEGLHAHVARLEADAPTVALHPVGEPLAAHRTVVENN